METIHGSVRDLNPVFFEVSASDMKISGVLVARSKVELGRGLAKGRPHPSARPKSRRPIAIKATAPAQTQGAGIEMSRAPSRIGFARQSLVD